MMKTNDDDQNTAAGSQEVAPQQPTMTAIKSAEETPAAAVNLKPKSSADSIVLLQKELMLAHRSPTPTITQSSSNDDDNHDEEGSPFNPFQEIMPLPPRPAASANVPQKPGAYATPSPPAFLSRRPTNGTGTRSETSHDHTGLVEAQAVHTDEETGLPDLPRAEELEESLEEREIKRELFWKRNLALAVAMLLVMIVLTLVTVLVPRNTKSNSNAQQVTSEMIPSQAPTSQEGYLLSLFPSETIFAIQEDPESPQSKAFQWLLEDHTHNPSLSHQRIVQRYALTTLYFATDGDMWTFREHWLNHSIHECNWQGREDFAMQRSYSQYYPGFWSEFFPPTDPTPTSCDVNGLYLNLWLDQNELVGSVPEELYLLTSLQTLSLIHNELEGSLSTKIGRLSHLDGLAISNLKEGGAIASEIGLLTGLRGLNLHDNGHKGAIPSQLWQLTNLETMFLSLNPDLQGSLPSVVGSLEKLRWVILKDCGLTGSIPSQIGQLESIEWLTLEANKLTGRLPTELGLLSTPFPLYLMSNQLTGTLPSELGTMTGLFFLGLRDNKLTGSLPTQIGLLTSLSLTLDLDNLLLSGTLPSEVGLLTNLEELSLSNSQLTGSLPSQLGLLSATMGWLDLSHNSFEGTLPEELASLQDSLYTFRLEGNAMLSGSIPAGLCSINGTCTNDLAYRPCRESNGLTFDCSGLLCGCGCDCSA